MNKEENQRILVTGCAGFIGERVCKLLLKNNYEVIGLDNLNNLTYSSEIKENRLKNLIYEVGFKFYEHDICNLISMDEIFKHNNIDSIIHLAAIPGVRQSIEYPQIYVDTNITGTLNLLELAVKYKIKKFVCASSSSVYGNNIFSSEENSANKPLSPYGATKKAMEILCYPYSILHGLDITILRYFSVYGENGRPDMAIYKFIDSIIHDKEITIYGSGDQQRDFTYVRDIVEGTVSSLKPFSSKYEIINLGNDNPITINKIISLIENILNKKAKIKFSDPDKSDPYITHANIKKAKLLLEWYPKTSVEKGLKKTVRWHNAC